GSASEPASGPEIARVEVSTDDGKTWTAVWTQAGTQVPGQSDTSEQNFNARSASLANYVGRLVLLRFNFDLDLGFFPSSDDPYGWYIDDIVLTSVDEAVNPTTTTLDSSATFNFAPAAAAKFGFQFQPIAGGRTLSYGPLYAVTAQTDPPQFTMWNTLSVSGNTLTFRFSRISG